MTFYHIKVNCRGVCSVILQYNVTLPDDLLDEHCVHGLFIEDWVLSYHFLNTEKLRDLVSNACYYLLHYLQYRKRQIKKIKHIKSQP